MLPTLGYEYTERVVTDSFAGLNRQLRIAEGEFYDMKNLTSACYPLLANRKKRGRVRALEDAGGLLAKEELAWVNAGTLYYGGEATALRGLAPGKKQLVSMGATICVFPDRKYYNTADPADCGSMEAEYTSVGPVRISLCREDGSDCETPVRGETAPEETELWLDTSGEKHVLRRWSAAVSEWVEIETAYTRLSFGTEGELPGLFRELDGVEIEGAAVESLNGSQILRAVGGGDGESDYLVVTGRLEESTTQTEGSIRISRKVPEMDFVIECRNRLWGCRYGAQDGKSLNEIYCCALGDFKNWRQYLGLSTDSWTASVGSDGPWTGAVNYLGCPMFFKENRIHRVNISASGAHQIAETVCRGVQPGCAGSLQVVNETLFYKSRADVCAYQGSFPRSISRKLGEESFSEAAAGSVGDRYYISMRGEDGTWTMYVYDIRRDLWMKEDSLHATDFARLGDELYCVAEGELLALTGSVGEPEPFVAWEAETGILTYEYPERKYVARYSLRLSMEAGAEVKVYLMYDSSGEWIRQGQIRVKGTRTVTLPIRPRRCDHLRVRLVGRGEVRLYSVARILTVGSDVG